MPIPRRLHGAIELTNSVEAHETVPAAADHLIGSAEQAYPLFIVRWATGEIGSFLFRGLKPGRPQPFAHRALRSRPDVLFSRSYPAQAREAKASPFGVAASHLSKALFE
jgi:hypothetical protein